MNVLIIGSGGREHAFAYKIKQSKQCDELFILLGNAGTANLGTNVPLTTNDFKSIGEFCVGNQIELLIVGPEDPLVNGMRDFFQADETLQKIAFVGPDKTGAQMEGSKDWSKSFMARNHIPTAAYQTFTKDQLQEGLTYVKQHTLPIVLKADGLAAGKGVIISESHSEAAIEFQAMLAESKFGSAGDKVVIEEFMTGIELSVFVVSDGKSYKVLPSAKDYKRIGVGEKGLNTGGMGAVSPVPFADELFMKKVEERIIIPTIEGLKKENINYIGFIFIGLMNRNGEPFVVEYNSRMGDPETEVVLPLINNDFLSLMHATATGNLANIQMDISTQSAATVMLVSKGYPEEYEKGKVITGAESITDSIVFHAGTKLGSNEEILSNGGRVIAVTSLANDLKTAVATSMKNAERIQFENKYYRSDIGFEF